MACFWCTEGAVIALQGSFSVEEFKQVPGRQQFLVLVAVPVMVAEEALLLP